MTAAYTGANAQNTVASVSVAWRLQTMKFLVISAMSDNSVKLSV